MIKAIQKRFILALILACVGLLASIRITYKGGSSEHQNTLISKMDHLDLTSKNIFNQQKEETVQSESSNASSVKSLPEERIEIPENPMPRPIPKQQSPWEKHAQHVKNKEARAIPTKSEAGLFYYKWDEDVEKEHYYLMAALDSLLAAHKITYYASAGTLLGCVRHMGVIPWDDDMDIVIPNTEFQKFRTLLQDFKKLGYSMRTWNGINNKLYPGVQQQTRSWPFLDVWNVKITANKPIALFGWGVAYSYKDTFPLKRAFCNNNLLLRVPYDSPKVLDGHFNEGSLEKCLTRGYSHKDKKKHGEDATKPCEELSKLYYFLPTFEAYEEGSINLIPPIIHQFVPEEGATPSSSCKALYEDWEFVIWTPNKLKELDPKLETITSQSVFKILRLYGGLYVPYELECKESVQELVAGSTYLVASSNECVTQAEKCVVGSTVGHFVDRLVERNYQEEANEYLRSQAKIFDVNKYFI